MTAVAIAGRLACARFYDARRRLPAVRSPFGITLVVTLAVGFAAQAAGLSLPVVLVLALVAGLAADAVVRRRQQR